MFPRLTAYEVAGFLEITKCRVRLLHSQNRINGYKDGLNVPRSKKDYKNDSDNKQNNEYKFNINQLLL